MRNIIMLILRKANKILVLGRKKLYSKILRCQIKGSGEDFTIFGNGAVRGGEHITVGNNFKANKDLQLSAWDSYEGVEYNPEIIIGDNAYLGRSCHITAIGKMRIGNNLLTGKNVYISDNAHGRFCVEESNVPPIKRELYSKGDVTIGNNVWLGDNVAILSGVTIGENVIVGINSVVTKSVPSNCVVVGSPAKVVKQLPGK